MGQMTNHMENKLADWLLRAQAWSLGANLYAAIATVATDASITEITGTGYARVGIARALASWSATQTIGSSDVSDGTTHTTSNNAAINFGNAGSEWAATGSPATHLVLFDASTGGNALCSIPLPNGALAIANGDPVSFAPGAISFAVGLTGGMTDYLANKVIDSVFRGEAFTMPASLYEALFTAAPGNAGGGTEASHSGYARVAVARSLASISGTQAAGSTVASTGSLGKVSNNASIPFASPGADAPAITNCGEFDAPTGGNLLFYAELSTPRSIVAGAAGPVFSPGARSWTFA